MRRLRKWWQLSRREKWLLLEALWWVGLIRLGLWLVRARRLSQWLACTPKPRPESVDVGRILWAVTAVSRVIPGATCLVQALAGRRLLAVRGHEVKLRLGVQKSPRGEFRAHAWLERAGGVVLGKLSDLDRFVVLESSLSAAKAG